MTLKVGEFDSKMCMTIICTYNCGYKWLNRCKTNHNEVYKKTICKSVYNYYYDTITVGEF